MNEKEIYPVVEEYLKQYGDVIREYEFAREGKWAIDVEEVGN